MQPDRLDILSTSGSLQQIGSIGAALINALLLDKYDLMMGSLTHEFPQGLALRDGTNQHHFHIQWTLSPYQEGTKFCCRWSPKECIQSEMPWLREHSENLFSRKNTALFSTLHCISAHVSAQVILIKSLSAGLKMLKFSSRKSRSLYEHSIGLWPLDLCLLQCRHPSQHLPRVNSTICDTHRPEMFYSQISAVPGKGSHRPKSFRLSVNPSTLSRSSLPSTMHITSWLGAVWCPPDWSWT